MFIIINIVGERQAAGISVKLQKNSKDTNTVLSGVSIIKCVYYQSVICLQAEPLVSLH